MARPVPTKAATPKSGAPKVEAPRFRDVAVNRRAFHDYEIFDRYEAGISLTGSEIKSVRDGKVSLQEAYARPEKGEIFLQGAHIAEYKSASFFGHEPRRSRRLLLHKKQIHEIEDEVGQKGLSLIPLRMYLKDGKAKVELGLAKGRREYDKRDAIAKRDADREIARALRQNNK